MKPFSPNEPVPGWTIERHLEMYRRGAFPMADSDEPDTEIRWYLPYVRPLIPLTEADGLHISRTIEREFRRARFTFTTDQAFPAVIRGCATPRDDDDGAWIDHRIMAMYERLHEAGHVHSLEAWRTDPATGEPALVGGVYGLSLGAAFFAESMFHLPRPRLAGGTRHPLDGTNASSCALVTLCGHLHACGYLLMDAQVLNDHTARFGAYEIDGGDFLARLTGAAAHPDCWRPLSPGR